jgi:hypothetical protein
MTADQRVAALEGLGFSARQSRFLATVALHSGYCLRRQYEAFAGIQYGKNVRQFLDGLVERRLADRFTGRADRGHVYHLHARALYRALGDEGNRNRRKGSAAQIARKLMLLDYVLSRPDVEWFATEAEKVHLFVQRFGVPPEALPRRMVRPTDERTAAHARFFLHKLPIYLSGEPPVVHFVYLATEAGGEGLMRFLDDHACLLHRLRGWTVVVIGVKHSAGFDACRSAFDAYVKRDPERERLADVAWYFAKRRIVEQGDLSQISVQDIGRLRALRQALATPRHEGLYASWLATGHLEIDAPVDESSTTPSGQLVVEPLPFAYEQFGSLPGVA